jgi:hypothetical protein
LHFVINPEKSKLTLLELSRKKKLHKICDQT